MKTCNNCVMDISDSKIVFDEKGVCDHCNTFYTDILPNWHTDERSRQQVLGERRQADKPQQEVGHPVRDE